MQITCLCRLPRLPFQLLKEIEKNELVFILRVTYFGQFVQVKTIFRRIIVLPYHTICLQQLSKQIASLNCGHFFHMVCITQHLQYRSACPSCLKQASLDEVRGIHFQLKLNTKANVQFRSLLSSLNAQDKTKMYYLLGEMKILTQAKEKVQSQAIQNQNQLKSRLLQIQLLKNKLGQQKLKNENYLQEITKLQFQIKKLAQTLDCIGRLASNQRIETRNAQKKLKQLQEFKKYYKILIGGSSELIKLKVQLELTHTPPDQMVRQFFQISQMSKLELDNEKQKTKDFQQQVRRYDQELAIQKQKTNRLQKELDKMNERIGLQAKPTIYNEVQCGKLEQKHFNFEGRKDLNHQQPRINSSSLSNNSDEKLQSAVQGLVKEPTLSGVKFGGLVSLKKNDILKSSK